MISILPSARSWPAGPLDTNSPSIMLIIYGMIDQVSVGQLYAGAFLPGFLLAAIFIAYITVRAYINPETGPPIPKAERASWEQKIRLLLPIIPTAVLIFLVLGTIVFGIAAPTGGRWCWCVGRVDHRWDAPEIDY